MSAIRLGRLIWILRNEQGISCEHKHARKAYCATRSLIYENPEGLLGSKRNRDWSVDAWLHACDLAHAPAACRLLLDHNRNPRAYVCVAGTAEKMK